MSQSASIIAFLLVGFVVYITIMGEIPKYKDAIFGAGVTTSATKPS